MCRSIGSYGKTVIGEKGRRNERAHTGTGSGGKKDAGGAVQGQALPV